MILLKIDKESIQMTKRAIELEAPNFSWKVLQSRADKLFDGNMEKCVNDLFARLVMDWFDGMVKGTIEASTN